MQEIIAKTTLKPTDTITLHSHELLTPLIFQNCLNTRAPIKPIRQRLKFHLEAFSSDMSNHADEKRDN